MQAPKFSAKWVSWPIRLHHARRPQEREANEGVNRAADHGEDSLQLLLVVAVVQDVLDGADDLVRREHDRRDPHVVESDLSVARGGRCHAWSRYLDHTARPMQPSGTWCGRASGAGPGPCRAQILQ
jgi:hypothetical protein